MRPVQIFGILAVRELLFCLSGEGDSLREIT
jgi:hypothetical protein